MAIDTITPVSGSTVEPGASVSFTVDDTYTSMVVQVNTDSGLEAVYLSASGGFQAGYSGSVSTSGGRDTFTFTRNAGWDVSPQFVYVTEDETGSSALTTLTYTLYAENSFPQGKNPYNGTTGGSSQDPDAIHKNIADEFVSIPEKITLVDDDLFLIEDSADGQNKKKVKRVNVGGGGGSGDVVGPAGATDNAIAVFDGATGKLLKDSTGTIAQITANTAKVTNATHTGEVTGDTALTIATGAVTNTKLGASAVTNDKIANATIVASTKLTATGTKDATTFLRGDDTYAVPGGSGDVVGPAGATDDALVVFDGVTGKLVKNSTGTIAQIVANTAKVTNATHTGDVTGATALTIAANAVVNSKILNATIVATDKLSATGTKDATTFLRGDNTWAVPAGGGGAVLPFEVFSRTQTADGGAVPGAGQWDISSGASGTPSGVAAIRVHEWTTAFAQDQSALFPLLAPGNIIKLTKSGEASEWAYYQVTQVGDAGLYRIISVTFLLASSGFDFDQSSAYYFSAYYSGTTFSAEISSSWQVVLPANTTDWVTHSLAGGYNDPVVNRNVSTGPTITYASRGRLLGGVGNVLGWKFSGYDTVDTSAVTIRPAILHKTSGVATSTSITPIYPHASAQNLPITAANTWTSYDNFNLTGTTGFVAGDELVVYFKNGGPNARTVYVDATLYIITLALG